MSTLSKLSRAYTYSQVSAQLSSVTYQSAIEHYNKLKENFKNSLSMALNDTPQVAENLFIQEVFNSIQGNEMETSFNAANDLFESIETAVAKALEGQGESFSSIVGSCEKKEEVATKLGQVEIQKAIQTILSDTMIEDLIWKKLTPLIGARDFDIQDIVAQAKGYRNRVILMNIKGQYKHYAQATKGFFKEALIYNAFGKLSDILGRKVATATGGLKVSGKDTVFDGYIDFFKNVESSFYINANESIPVSMGYGYQSKSWFAPWEKKGYEWNGKYSMGQNVDLLYQALTETAVTLDTFSWIHGVKFLENHLITAIGNTQVAFSTGGGIYWTGDLIAMFREMGYFYAFIFNKEHKATSKISWQTINMTSSKNWTK